MINVNREMVEIVVYLEHSLFFNFILLLNRDKIKTSVSNVGYRKTNCDENNIFISVQFSAGVINIDPFGVSVCDFDE